MQNTCDGCCHFISTEKFRDLTVYRCRLTRSLLTGKPCKLFNFDLAGKLICINCQYFLGGGDWGLACEKHYYYLPEPLTNACDDFLNRTE